MPVSIPTDTIILDILSTAQAYSGCPVLTGDYWLNSQRFYTPTWILLLDAQGAEVSPSPVFNGVHWLKLNTLNAPLARFPDADGYVDSQELLRRFNVYMSTLKGYRQSHVESPFIQMTLNQEIFYLLPAIPVDNKNGERVYYLTADGNHNWKRLQPDELDV